MSIVLLENRDLKGRVIDQRLKDSKSVEIDPTGKFNGHRFLFKTRLFGDKRCIYCGRWFHWKDTDFLSWMRQKNIDNMNKDGALEPLHCGSEHCQEFHRRYLIHQEKMRKEEEGRREILFFDLFKKLKREGLIA
jgi:hypothetical protein